MLPFGKLMKNHQNNLLFVETTLREVLIWWPINYLF